MMWPWNLSNLPNFNVLPFKADWSQCTYCLLRLIEVNAHCEIRPWQHWTANLPLWYYIETRFSSKQFFPPFTFSLYHVSALVKNGVFCQRLLFVADTNTDQSRMTPLNRRSYSISAAEFRFSESYKMSFIPMVNRWWIDRKCCIYHHFTIQIPQFHQLR